MYTFERGNLLGALYYCYLLMVLNFARFTTLSSRPYLYYFCYIGMYREV